MTNNNNPEVIISKEEIPATLKAYLETDVSNLYPTGFWQGGNPLLPLFGQEGGKLPVWAVLKGINDDTRWEMMGMMFDCPTKPERKTAALCGISYAARGFAPEEYRGKPPRGRSRRKAMRFYDIRVTDYLSAFPMGSTDKAYADFCIKEMMKYSAADKFYYQTDSAPVNEEVTIGEMFMIANVMYQSADAFAKTDRNKEEMLLYRANRIMSTLLTDMFNSYFCLTEDRKGIG